MYRFRNLIILLSLFVINLKLKSDQTIVNNSSFVIVVPSYNNKDWFKKNLDSIFNQTYKNYRVIYIDDNSTDGTGDLVQNYITNNNLDEKIKLIRNKERKLALWNLYDAIHSCKPNEIVATVDGDDHLKNENVLSHLNKIYSDKNVWLTYGQFIEYPNNLVGSARELPKHIIDNNEYRKYDWVTTHLRTFYAGLFQKIKKEDLLYEGKFFPMTWDVAMLYPMLEMAGHHTRFIPEILYVYNTETPLNDRKIDINLQCNLYNLIRTKKSYEKVDKLFDDDSNNKNFVILIPSYNNAKYYKKNLDSVLNQNYSNYRVIYIDDHSQDNTGNLVEEYLKENDTNKRVKLIKNQKRQLALANIYKGVLMTNDKEIIAIVDGDDELAEKNVLNKLNEIYKDENVWVTYGNFKYLSNNSPCDYDPTFPESVIKENKFREYPHGLTHLRTFYSWLFKQIKIEDLFYENNFYKMTYDVAIFTPLIEMTGDKHKYIREVLYIYNDLNAINDHRVSMNMQHYLNKIIRQKNKYSRLEENKSGFISHSNNQIDLIIFINKIDDIKHIHETTRNISNLNKKFIIYETFNESESKNYESIKDELKDFVFIETNQLNENIKNLVFTNIFNSGADFVMFLNSKTVLNKKINIFNFIETLETTKAFAFYSSLKKDTFIAKYLSNNCSEISTNLYPFLYQKAKTVDGIDFAIYRKKDININQFNSFDKIEIQWKNIGWNKVCLFKIID